MVGIARPELSWTHAAVGVLAVVLAALLVGCDPAHIDNDGDGYSESGGDCDDTNAAVSPDGSEGPDWPSAVPDGLDNDCNGIVDDGTTEFDDDQDGFTEEEGDCDDSLAEVSPDGSEGALPPSSPADELDNDCNGIVDDTTEAHDDDGDGFTEVSGDCDDTRAEAYPDAPELCNGLDEACDGATEDEDDGDADGYRLCEGDCSDNDAAVHPVADETAGDGQDSNCDGNDATADVGTSDAVATWSGQVPGELFGTSVIGCPDGLDELFAVGAPGLSEGTDQGRVYVVAAGLPVPQDPLQSYIEGDDYLAGLGGIATPIGDVTCDGVADFAVGAPGHNEPDLQAGRAYVFAGPLVEGMVLEDAYAVVHGDTSDAAVGSAIVGLGDLDGNGCDEVAFSSPSVSTQTAGRVEVVSKLPPGTSVFGELGVVVASDVPGDRFGQSMQLVKELPAGDGPRLLVGAPHPFAAKAPGAIYSLDLVELVPLSPGTVLSPAAVSELHQGPVAGELFGRSIELLDLASSRPLVVVGAPLADSGAGQVYGLELEPDGTLAEEVFSISSASAGGRFGVTVSALGDLNGDGFEELAVGAPIAAGGGFVAVLAGPFRGTLSTLGAVVMIQSNEEGARAGTGLQQGCLAGALLVGSPRSDLSAPDGGELGLFDLLTHL